MGYATKLALQLWKLLFDYQSDQVFDPTVGALPKSRFEIFGYGQKTNPQGLAGTLRLFPGPFGNLRRHLQISRHLL
jgi:hypothetical protein